MVLPPQYSTGDIAWVLAASCFVWLMIPGIGYFYAGTTRSPSNALAMIMCSVMSLVVVTVQWFIWGYSLCYSKSASYFIGNFENAFLRGIYGEPSTVSQSIPDIIFLIFQCMIAALAPALAIGSAASRARLLPLIVFIFVWSTLVYDVIACWVWNENGWIYKMGVLDFAGGTPVHICSGFASLAYAVIIGRRSKRSLSPPPTISLQQQQQQERHHKKSMSSLITGCAFLWFGWFGFNGGSALGGNLRAGMSLLVTNLSASVGALAWMGMDYWKKHQFSALSFCSGAVAGLVAITPSAGFVGPAPAVAIGLIAGVSCNGAAHFKHWLNFDDVADVFAIHGVGGYLGSIMTGIFAEQYIASLDDKVIAGGWINGHWIQVPLQLADATAGAAWSFCVTYIILLVMDRIPGLSMRVPREHDIRQFISNQRSNSIDSNNPPNSNYSRVNSSSDNLSSLGQTSDLISYFQIDRIVTVNHQTGEQRIVKDQIIELEHQPRRPQPTARRQLMDAHPKIPFA